MTVGNVNDAKLTITAREVYFRKASGRDTRIMVTLSKGGTLKVARVSSGQVYYCKANPRTPSPRWNWDALHPGRRTSGDSTSGIKGG